MRAHRVLAVVGVLALGLALVGCNTLAKVAAAPPSQRARVAAARPAPAPAAPAEATAAPRASKPVWLERYIRHRLADFWDCFGFSFGQAPILHMYGVDAGIDIVDIPLGLGFLHADGGSEYAIEGRGTYAAPHKQDLWRFLVLANDFEVVDIDAGVGNPYAKPAAHAGSRDYAFYRAWDTDVTKTMAYESPIWTDGAGKPLTTPIQRIVHNSEKDGAYRALPDGFSKHIFGAHVEVAFPGEPLVLKRAFKLGVKLNWCQVADFVIGLVTFDLIDQYQDDLFNR